jgi:hypothetical protein
VWSPQITPTPISDKSDPFVEEATEPTIETAPDGSEIMIAYVREDTSNNINSYFSVTSNNGNSWSGPNPIFSSTLQSLFVDIAYGSNNVAHAVWREDIDLVYMERTNWGSGTPITLTAHATGDPGATDPKIFASDNGTLDVVWSDSTGGNFNIHHIRHTVSDGWGTLGGIPITTTIGSSDSPSLTVDQSVITPNLHAVWAQQVLGALPVIYYAQGTPQGGTAVTWSKPITISKGAITDKALYPEVIQDGSTLFVAYTHWQDNSQAWEKAHLVQCNQDCEKDPANWSLVAESSQFASYNLSPNDSMLSDVIHSGRCTFVYHSGLPKEETIERMFGFSSCDSPLDADDVLAFRRNDGSLIELTTPSLAVNGAWLHLAFELNDGGKRQVYVLRGRVPTYFVDLPIALKN